MQMGYGYFRGCSSPTVYGVLPLFHVLSFDSRAFTKITLGTSFLGSFHDVVHVSDTSDDYEVHSGLTLG